VGHPLAAQEPAALADRLDSLVPGWMEEYHVPGVAVAVVRRDSVLLARGWGVAEADGGRPVTAETPFRVASLSKLVTATAALRLVEQGALDLHRDIGGVLGPEDVPRRFGGSITLHHLLTHTAGFDLSDVGDATPMAEEIVPLRELVARYPEPQVLPPGLAYHYANFGFALVGRLVERAAGEPFAEHVQRAIFQPLGMHRSSFRQPPPPAIADDLAGGHAWSGGGYRRLPLDFSHVAPADAMVTTARDMAAFLRFHLGGGPPVLSAAMRDTMHATQYAASPSPYGMAYAFEENVLAGRRVLQHGGAQLGFESFLVLLPEDDLGVFIAQNAREGALRWAILDAVFETLLEEREGPPARDPGRADAGLDPAPYTGVFRHTGYTHSTFEKSASVLGFRGSLARVAPGPEPGTLLIDGRTWRHAPALGRHMFVDPTAEWWVKGFIVGEDGIASHHVAGREVLQRLAWWEQKRAIQMALLLTTLFAMASGVLWPTLRRVRNRRGGVASSPSREKSAGGLARGAVQLVSLLWIAAIVDFFVTMAIVMNRDVQFDYGPNWELLLMLTLLLLASAGALALPVVAVLSWWRRWWNLPARMVVSVQALLAPLAVAALHYMNLIGYRF
jgi:CubicO group peptidase (beta-lactamase class C family)